MNILGLCSGTHDSAAALICEGRLIGLVEEERLSGEKHTRAYPSRSVTWLLDHTQLGAGDVHEVAYNFAPLRYLGAVPASLRYLAHPATARRAVPRARSFARVHLRARQRVRSLQQRFPAARVRGVPHHRAHALYAYAASGQEEAAILIADSLGETATTTIWHMAPTRHKLTRALRDPASLGYAYGALTQHLGWRRGDEEGTVMALAALGDPTRFRDLLARAIPLTRDGFTLDPRLLPLRVISSRYGRVSAAFTASACPPRAPEDDLEEVHADLAAALQERTEQVMLHLARQARRHTGAHVLCLGGGVAMNCVAAGRIAHEAGFAEVFVPPAPGDSGTAAGAALAVSQDRTGALATGVTRRCYLGPSYETPHLDLPTGLKAQRISNPSRFLAHQLARGTIAGLFHGRLEAGPRALGNRSILASPLKNDVMQRLNDTVKFREPFRPFAPVVLAERAADYFTLGQPSPYMSIASGVTALARETIPSVVHLNGTARVQTLTRDQNPFLAEVLATFAAITGVPVLINTSLNVKGKPISGTPEMALECLASSGLDALLIADWWVTRK